MKVDGHDVIRTIITIVLLGEVVKVGLNYRVWSTLPGFPMFAVEGIIVLSVLMLPIIWVPRLRRKILLNAALFLSMFTLVGVTEWVEFGNQPISYAFGALWLGLVIAFIFDFRRRRRREKAGELVEIPGESLGDEAEEQK